MLILKEEKNDEWEKVLKDIVVPFPNESHGMFTIQCKSKHLQIESVEKLV